MQPHPRFNLAELAHLDDVSTSGDKLNDIWGYVDDSGVEYALVGRRDRLDVVDISTDPSNPNVVSSISGPTSLWRDVKTRSDYAFVVHDDIRSGTPTGLQVVDLSDPTNTTVATATTAQFEHTHNIFVEGDYLYACSAHRSDGSHVPLIVVDVSTPTSPTEVGTYTGTDVHDIFVRDDRAYAAAKDLPGVKILDVSTPGSPTELGEIVTPEDVGHNTWLSDDGDYCFVTNEELGGHLRIYDVSSPSAPTHVAEYEAHPDRVIHNVYVADGVAYISYYGEGVVLLDVSDPANPRELAVYDTSDVPLPDPPSERAAMHGVWGLYPFFPSGRIAASDIERGLYVFERTRSPVDAVLCLDRSGSMANPPPGGSSSKFELLQQAVDLFVGTWAPFAAPDDRLGVVFFETNVTSYPPGGGDVLRPFPDERSALTTYVEGISTGNFTAMGSGLQRAFDAFDAGRKSRRVVLLFTDGRQNQSPKVAPDADGELRLNGEHLAAHGAEVYTIGTGVDGVDWETLLADIADQTNGRHHFTATPDADLRDFFEDHLVRTLRGETVQAVGAERGTLDGETDHRFDEPGTARRITVTCSWTGDADADPDLTVVSPDGTALTDPHDVESGPRHRVISYRTPIVADGRAVATCGTWTVRVAGQSGGSYRLSMLVDDWTLHPRIGDATPLVDLDDPIPLTAWPASDDGVTAEVDRLAGAISRPRTALGEFLSEAPAPDQVDSPEPIEDVRDRILAGALADDEIPDPLRPRTQQIALGRELESATAQQSGGWLRTTVRPGVPGSYRFDLRLAGETADGCPFQRRAIETVVVPAAIDAERSDIERDVAAERVVWTVTPRDGAGCRLGPGLADRFRVEPALADVETRVAAEDADTYRVAASLPEDVPPGDLTLAFEGTELAAADEAPEPCAEGSLDADQRSNLGT